MPRSSRFALFILLFSALIFAGLAGSRPRGVGAAAPDFGRVAPPPAGRDTLRAAFGLSFAPSRSLLLAPGIDGVSPSPVTPSSLLRVTGVGFGAAPGQLLIGGKTPTFIAHWSDGLILAYVPEDVSLGEVPVEVTTAEGTDSAVVNVNARQSSGRIRWSFNVASGSVPARPAVGPDGTIYFNDDAGRLYALAPDGALKWVFRAGSAAAGGPVAVGADGTVYAAGSVGKDPAQTCADPDLQTVSAVFAVNPDGTQKWRFDQTCQRMLSGPSVGPDGKIYGVTDKGGLGAFALSDAGALAWHGGNFGDPDSKGREIVFGPTAAGGTATQQYFQFKQTGVGTQGQFFAYTLAGGEVYRRAVAEGGQPVVGALTGNVFVTTGDGPGSQIRSWTPQGAHRWFSNAYPEVSFSDLDAAPDETLYVVQDGHFLHSLSAASGNVSWTYYEADAHFSTPAASPDNLLALVGGHIGPGGSGFVNAVGTNGRLLWKQQLPNLPGLFPGGQARPTARARFTSDAQTAYVATETAGDDALPASERRSLIFALDTSTNGATEGRPPTVTLTSPPNGAIRPKNTDIQLTAEVLDDGPATRVDFYRIAGGVTQFVGSDATAPYSVPFNTGAPGTYQLQAVATDEGGLTGESARHTLNVVNEGPRVSFVSPADWSWFPSGSTINITVHPTDIDGQVTKVEFRSSRGGDLGTDTTPDADGNYSVTYSPAPGTSQEGTQQIWAYPKDDDGAGGAAFINITVGGTPTATPTPIPTPTPNPEPGVRIVSPAHGSSFPAGTTVQVSVEALDADGTIADVKIYRAPSGALLGTDTTAPYTFALTDALPNVYDLYAVATDDSGLSMTSATVQVAFYDPEAPFFINGQIRHQQGTSGNPIYLTNALVRLDKDGAPYREARTDSFGNYTFDHLAQGGSYTVRPAEPGYIFAPQTAAAENLDDSRTFDFTASGPLPPAPVPMPTPGAVVQWERFFDGGQNNVDLDPVVTADLQGNTVVAARSRNTVNSGQMGDEDITVIKYDPAGQRLWTRRYAGPGGQLDAPVAVRADANGNVYVFGTEFGGYSSWYNFVTIKYAPDGTELWVRAYDGPLGRYDFGTAMTLDAAGNCIVTGYSETTYPDSSFVVTEYATVKYDPLGNRKWVNRYSTAHVFDNPADITTDAAGNVYVTGLGLTQRGGSGIQNAVTVKYAAGGARAWVAQFNGKPNVAVNDYGVSVKHDGRGGLYVAGDSVPGSTSRDFFLAKYNDATGALLWSRIWAGPSTETLKDMAIDLAGNVVLTGESIDPDVPSNTNQPNYDAATVKYDGAGNLLWARTYQGALGGADSPQRVFFDAVGNIYVGLRSNNGSDDDAAVIKYLADGTEAWVYRYDHGTSDTMRDMAIDVAGRIYVTGYFGIRKEDGTNTADIETFKLLASSPGLNSAPDVTLTIDGPTIVGSPVSGAGESDTPQTNGPTIVGRSLTLNATASDRDGIVSRVDFYDGSTHVGTDTTAPYSVNWHDPAPGTHAVTARATDYFGVTASSQVVNVTVSGDPTPTPTPTPSPTPTPVPTPTPTVTPTPTPTPVPTPTPTPIPTPTPLPTPTPTPVSTPTPTPSPTPTPTPSATPTPTPAPTPEPQTFVLADATACDEESGAVAVTVRRTGDLSRSAGVDYETADGTAREGYDYIMASGTLTFAAGEGAKQVRVLLVNDAHGEQAESFTMALSNPWGDCSLGTPHTSALTITENDTTAAGVNPVDGAAFFVGEHYADFFGREADASGRQFWTSEIESCGSDAQCREVKRVNVSAAFFLSIEFQQTGYLAYRARKAAFGDLTGKPVPVTREELLRDVRVIGSEVIVNADGWRERLERNKEAYFEQLTASQRFTALYPAALTPEQFVDALNANAGGALSQGERDTLVAELKGGLKTRAQVLRAVAEDADLSRAEFNKAFVLMQYLGYLRRNPDAGPDSDFGGWRFWLSKLDEFDGDFVRAEMVKAFLDSAEYRQRFGQ
jgi:hypothetical protein